MQTAVPKESMILQTSKALCLENATTTVPCSPQRVRSTVLAVTCWKNVTTSEIVVLKEWLALNTRSRVLGKCLYTGSRSPKRVTGSQHAYFGKCLYTGNRSPQRVIDSPRVVMCRETACTPEIVVPKEESLIILTPIFVN